MILSKAEMEDIWHNKPVGYWDRYKKTLKKQKFFSVEVQACKYVYGENETFAVKALTKYEAEETAKALYRKKHNVDKYPTWKLYVREIK